MKKRGLVILLLLLVFSFSFIAVVSAADNSTSQGQVDKAYSCLNNKTSGKCSSLSTEEKTFTVLATGQCQAELMSDSSNSGQCWPSSSCTVKATSQAILALKNTGRSTQSAENWLLSNNATATGLTWYLEIDSPNSTSCNVQYSGQAYTVNIDENKKLSGNAGSCLTLSPDGYLLRVSPSCYSQDISVSCANDFLTTTLFQQTGSPTIYVSDKTSSAASQGTTTENIKSYCLANKGTCDYEGTLWGALALNSFGVDVSAYLPYLITMAESNQRFLPDSFLYALTANNDYKVSLLSEQKSSEYWMESGDKYYDTAVALYPLQSESPQEKINAQNWLLSTQDSGGCWQGNIRNTAFILASVWPKQISSGTGASVPDCTASGYYCMSSASCTSASGNALSQYTCSSSINICCSQPQQTQTCSEQGGSLCSSGQTCIGGTIVGSSDATNSQLCCLGGSCQIQQSSQCDLNNGVCRPGTCNSGEQASTNYACTLQGDTCCIASGGTSITGGSSLWIWILVILIVLVLIGILFRKKIRQMWQNRKKKGSQTGPGQGPFFRPPFNPSPMLPRYNPPMRPPERRIMPPSQPPQMMRRPASKSQKELDDVLKKLKDMGK